MGTAIEILANDRDVQLVKKTVAHDLIGAELDLFIHMCRRWRLDPLRRQIYANVYKRKRKGDNGWETVRQVVYVTGIDGYRTIADRTGNYRPGNRSVCEDADLRNPSMNPYGIVSATATVWKHVHGAWHEFSETAYWEEFAPLKDEWENDQKTGRKVLDTSGQWGKMGRVMLQKCAEAQALRRGWPDEYGDLYISEEMDQASIVDVTPSEQAARADLADRQEKLGGPSIIVSWTVGSPLASVAADKFHGLARDFIRKNAEEPMTILSFADRNKEALRQFWTLKPEEALDLKKAFETYKAASASLEAA